MASGVSQRVTSLNLSKRLKELRVKQKSLFWWNSEQRKGRKRKVVNPYRKSLGNHWVLSSENKGDGISAYLSDELGEKLKDLGFDLPWYSGKGWWTWSIMSDDGIERSEVDARASMLIAILSLKKDYETPRNKVRRKQRKNRTHA